MDCTNFNNTYNNISYRQKSRTFQPSGKKELIEKFLESQSQLMRHNCQGENYANVDVINTDEPAFSMLHHTTRHPFSYHQSRPSYQQHLHSRSHSQHHYHTMHQCDMNNYYNISSNVPALPRSIQPPPINDPSPPPIHNQQFDTMTIMRICNEIGHLDSSPPTPEPRNYSIMKTHEGLVKVGFPQIRTMKTGYHDPIKGNFIKPGEAVQVLECPRDDRSKFTICYHGKYMDVPHQHTHPPRI